ncbi:hypothetical protein FDECE_15941 [Fusarium decemcellulare]|nr:hypothetical protein FDECE_15941 [Fusarium decemcellulare]
MVFDTLSIICRLEQFSCDFGEAHEKLRWYNLQISGANIEIQAWRRLWCEEFPYTDQDYEYLWGTGPEEAGRPVPKEKRVRSRDSWFNDLLNKLLFASYRGANLEERIKRLRDKIQALTSDSEKLFIQTQFWLSGSDKADGDTIRRVNERKELMEERNKELRQFHSLSGYLGEWSLVLTLPREGSGPNLIDEEARFYMKFIHRPVALMPPDARSPIFITFSTPMGNPSDFRLWYEHQVQNAAPVPMRSEPLLGLFPIYQDRKPGRRKSLVHAAIGIVNWTMLLWGMPWTMGICSYRLRFVVMHSTDGTAASRASITNSTEPCPKNPSGQHSKRLALSMGISLAELALKQPITLNATSNEMIFHLDGSPEPTYEQQLLKLVKRRSTLQTVGDHTRMKQIKK